MLIGTATLNVDWHPDTVFVMVTLYVPANVAVVAAVLFVPEMPGPDQL